MAGVEMYYDDTPIVVKSFDTDVDDDGNVTVWAIGYIDPESKDLDQYARRQQKRMRGQSPDGLDPVWIKRLAISALVAYATLIVLVGKLIFG